MKHKISSALLVLLSFGAYSQSNTVTGGGTASGSGGSSTYTIGQIDYSNSIGTDGSYNQGVQQPFEFFQESGIEGSSLIELSIYPNPTSDQIVLNVEQSGRELYYLLFDMNGKLINKSPISGAETIIDMRSYSPGEYHITISEFNEKIESFKIIKH